LRSLADLERRHGKLTTATVLTGSGGRHYWFRHPGGELRNSAGQLGPGLDLRASGGYVVAPPSVHESGNPYKWTRERDRATTPPAWLLEDVEKRRNGPAPTVADAIPEGKRNAELASLAGTMRRRGMGEQEILAALVVTNEQRCRPPLPIGELERIAASIGRYTPQNTFPAPYRKRRCRKRIHP
jgi:putative DNA primase/helicase